MAPQRLPAPEAPAEAGVHAGRAYLVWEPPAAPPWPGVVIVHGAGSQKENHADFGRACAAAGWAALAYDQRGHGESGEEASPRIVGDVATMAKLLGSRPGVDSRRICARGSSLGGFVAIQAAAGSPLIAGAIAVCPAGERHLISGLRRGELELRVSERGRDELAAWLCEHPILDAVRTMAGKPLFLAHARGDERIEWQHSQALYEAAGEPRRIVVLPGGSHRSVQHDQEIQGESLRWLRSQLG